MSERKSALIRLKNWLIRQLVTPVPDEIAQCEFGCRKRECAGGEWESCSNRIKTLTQLSHVQSGNTEE